MGNMWNISKQFDKVMTQIAMQDHDIKCWGMQPNRVILGKYIYDILEREFRYGVYSAIEHYKDDNVAYVIGLPITIDIQNKWLIKVCYGFETDGKELLYPDKIDPEQIG